jgi:hypothetical protein
MITLEYAIAGLAPCVVILDGDGKTSALASLKAIRSTKWLLR